MRRSVSRTAAPDAPRSLRAATLVILAVVVMSARPATAVLAQEPVPPAAAPVRRAFEHRFHLDLPCRGCHGAGATHRQTLVHAPQDCAACHHDPQRGLSCVKCHSGSSLPAERHVSQPFRLAVRTSPTERPLTFRHEPHVASTSGLGCRDCHATEVTLARNRDCTSCHDSHHAGAATCSRCHEAPRAGAHNESAHLGCATAGCHAANRAPAPTSSRELCLFCHQSQRNHEVGGTCAACHRIPGMTVGGAP